MNNEFYKYINSFKTDNEFMPLFHNTKPTRLLKILKEGVLKKKPCKVLNHDVSYLFYGRPAYKIQDTNKPTSLNNLFPVCMIFKTIAFPKIYNIYPFDSGAFNMKLYHPFIDEDYSLDNYLLGKYPMIAKKYVEALFGNNENYYNGELKDISKHDTPYIIDGLINLINDKAPQDFDDRKYTMEFVLEEDIILNKCLEAIILPRSIMMKKDIFDELSNIGCDIISYSDINGFTPIQYCTAIFYKAKNYMESKGVI